MLIDPFLNPPRLLEVSHVAHRLGFSQPHVRQLIRDGEIGAYRFGNRYRISEEQLQVFAEARLLAKQVKTRGDQRRDRTLHPVHDTAANR